jgi:hypothetical protein
MRRVFWRSPDNLGRDREGAPELLGPGSTGSSDFMKNRPRKPWSRTGSAYLGAFLGMGIAMAHQIHHAFVGDILAENPFTHIFPELLGLTAGGALLLMAVAEIRNRL